MKKVIIISLLVILSFSTSCKKEFENTRVVTADIIYQTPEAYLGLILGMTKKFTFYNYVDIIEGPSLTAKETGSTNTYLTPQQFARGGKIDNENRALKDASIALHGSRSMAEKILLYVDDVNFNDPDKKIAYKAYAKFIKAMTTGYMAQYWEKVTLANNIDNQAEYVTREIGLQQSISDIDSALNDIVGNGNAESIINNLVSYEFSFKDVLYAFKARYEIELGNYQEAYDAASAVDLTKRSVWSYDGGNIKNPIYSYLVLSSSETFKPIEQLGLQGARAPEAGDLRIDFYLQEYLDTADNPVYDINCSGIRAYKPKGFWTTESSPIPVYLPGEMILTKAEAKARMGGGNLVDAVTLLNEVREKTPANDVFGVGASLGAWTGNASSQQDVLDEIYKNYAIELYLQGQRFPIHRRFYPNYLDGVNWNSVDCCSLERVNNFYPYPASERANNPNCPPDPSL